MMLTKAENRAQLEAVAEKMKARRRSKDSSKERAKLKAVADKMKTSSTRKSRSRASSEDKEGVSKPRRSRTKKTPSRSKSGSSFATSSSSSSSSMEASLGKLSMDDQRRSPVADWDESSVSTYSTAPESGLNNSYTGSLDSRSVLSMHSSNNSSLNRMLSAANSSSQELLDCSVFLIITNLWETVKRIEGYEADLGEHIICRMMIAADAGINVRQELGLTSFRSERFAQLARHLMDTIDVLVTMLGPDIDDDELREIGANMRDQGIQPKLFGESLALAMRDLVGEAALAPGDFDAWEKAFRFVCRKMDM